MRVSALDRWGSSSKHVCRSSRPCCALVAVLVVFGLASCSGRSEGSSTTLASGERIVEAPTAPEQQLLDEAMSAYDRGLFKFSRELWTRLRDGYPASQFTSLAELKIADCYYFSEEYTEALAAYEEFARLHPAHEATTYVRFQIANSNFEQYEGPEHDQSPLHTSMKIYKQLLVEHPDTLYASTIRRRINEVREALAEHEAYVTRFYLRTDQLRAAANRVQILETRFADTSIGQSIRDQLTAELDAETFSQLESEIASIQYTIAEDKLLASLPSTPRVVLANTLRGIDQFPKIARGKYRESLSPPMVLSALRHSGPVAARRPITSMARLSCAQQDETTIITMQLADGLDLELDTEPSQEITGTVRAGDQFQLTTASEAASLECANGSVNATLVFTSLASGANSLHFSLRVSAPKRSRLRSFALDRPTRLVSVLF